MRNLRVDVSTILVAICGAAMLAASSFGYGMVAASVLLIAMLTRDLIRGDVSGWLV